MKIAAQPRPGMHDLGVDSRAAAIDRLGDALDEATVFRVALEPEAARCRLWLDVSSLLADGPLDPDPRRVLILGDVSTFVVMLRADDAEAETTPAVKLADLEAFERFLQGIEFGDSMYGARYIDEPDPMRGWPSDPSLQIVLAESRAAHSLHWFTHGQVAEGDEDNASYLLEGVVWFNSAEMTRAGGSNMPLEEAIDDANRWWKAFNERDPRLSVASQNAAGTALTWGRRRTVTYVPGAAPSN